MAHRCNPIALLRARITHPVVHVVERACVVQAKRRSRSRRVRTTAWPRGRRRAARLTRTTTRAGLRGTCHRLSRTAWVGVNRVWPHLQSDAVTLDAVTLDAVTLVGVPVERHTQVQPPHRKIHIPLLYVYVRRHTHAVAHITGIKMCVCVFSGTTRDVLNKAEVGVVHCHVAHSAPCSAAASPF